MEPQLARFSSVCEAPRWANVPSFLRDQAWNLGLKIEVEVDKGWIRERVRFRIEGEPEKVNEFLSRFKEAGEQYNSQIPAPR